MKQRLKEELSPGQVVQLVGPLFCTPKGCGFDSQSGHIPRLQVQSLVRAHSEEDRLMFLSQNDVSLPTSLKSINIFSGENFEKKKG